MPNNSGSKRWKAFLVVSALTLIVSSVPLCAQETVLHTFKDSDGNEPIASLISDASGNLYGTTFYGGANGVGTVYELKRSSSGAWSEKVLHSFNIDGIDGYFTTAALAFDGAGNLYGTTFFGGTSDRGTVFELSPVAGGGWTEKVLHSFLNDSTDGGFPRAAVAIDSSGNLYGTTTNGGPNDFGVVYQLTSDGSGNWTETILHTFSGTDGANPFGRLLLDSAGNLYGTTSAGGGSTAQCKFGCGTVFELKKSSGGTWTEKLLHNFTINSKDGTFPYGALVADGAGNLYGTTNGGGAGNNGTVFELVESNGWKEKQLHTFNAAGDGVYPTPGVVFDGSGNLYGTTQSGGALSQGAVFKLTPATKGFWPETIIYSFDPNGSGGYDPAQGLTIDSAGHIYGTVISGGAFGDGTAFEITP